MAKTQHGYFHFFKTPIILALIGLGVSFIIGRSFSSASISPLRAMYLAAILAGLEFSFSFDNAVINSLILKRMPERWQKRFITWGILIAVFGMRLLFPLLIVSVLTQTSPLAALNLAIDHPDKYSRLMLSAHASIAAFGGSFLFLVSSNFFLQGNTGDQWISLFEKRLIKLKELPNLKIAIVLFMVAIFSFYQTSEDQTSFLLSGISGIITFVLVNSIGNYLGGYSGRSQKANSGMALFIYLEVLDASFSLDGVIGGFAITHNLLLIMVGLGVGAVFVRSLTLMFVRKEELLKYKYLKHGAFYAIGILSLLMFADTIMTIPSTFTGTIGIAIIAVAFYYSIREKRKESN